MNGGKVQRSTFGLTSVRGLLTLKTFSALLNVPESPVIDSMLAVSRARSAAWTAGVNADVTSASAVKDERSMRIPS